MLVKTPNRKNPQQNNAARQLFNEAMDPATLDGANTNLPSKGSTLHGTGRPETPKPWERSNSAIGMIGMGMVTSWQWEIWMKYGFLMFNRYHFVI